MNFPNISFKVDNFIIIVITYTTCVSPVYVVQKSKGWKKTEGLEIYIQN